MSESILNIIPDRKFQISWQPNDMEDKDDWGFYSLGRVDEIDYKRPNAKDKYKDHLEKQKNKNQITNHFIYI